MIIFFEGTVILLLSLSETGRIQIWEIICKILLEVGDTAIADVMSKVWIAWGIVGLE